MRTTYLPLRTWALLMLTVTVATSQAEGEGGFDDTTAVNALFRNELKQDLEIFWVGPGEALVLNGRLGPHLERWGAPQPGEQWAV